MQRPFSNHIDWPLLECLQSMATVALLVLSARQYCVSYAVRARNFRPADGLSRAASKSLEQTLQHLEVSCPGRN
jgi:hypothetical protein